MQPPTMVNFIQHFCHEHNLDQKTTCLAMVIVYFITRNYTECPLNNQKKPSFSTSVSWFYLKVRTI